jgi:hypothetical protein
MLFLARGGQPRQGDGNRSMCILGLSRLLPKSFFVGSETFFDKSEACSRRYQNSPLGLKQLISLILRLAKIYEQKTFQRTTQKDFGLGNSPFRKSRRVAAVEKTLRRD